MSDQIAIVEIPYKKPATFTVYGSEAHFITLVTGMTQKTGASPPEDFHDATEFFCWDLKSHITVRSAADVDTVEAWTGSQIEIVRAMAAELWELFPAEPEAEPEEECFRYICEWNGERVEGKLSVRMRCEVDAKTPFNAQLAAAPIFRKVLDVDWCQAIPHGYIKVTLVEPEAEPEEEYVLRHINGTDGATIPCGNCGYHPVPTRWNSKEQIDWARCKVCSDNPRSSTTPGFCYQTNMMLAAYEKIRPAEGELATPAELEIRELGHEYRTSFQEHRAEIKKFGFTGLYVPGEGISATKCACRFATDFMDIMDIDESQNA